MAVARDKFNTIFEMNEKERHHKNIGVGKGVVWSFHTHVEGILSSGKGPSYRTSWWGFKAIFFPIPPTPCF